MKLQNDYIMTLKMPEPLNLAPFSKNVVSLQVILQIKPPFLK